jgi:hypothetical protein
VFMDESLPVGAMGGWPAIDAEPGVIAAP